MIAPHKVHVRRVEYTNLQFVTKFHPRHSATYEKLHSVSSKTKFKTVRKLINRGQSLLMIKIVSELDKHVNDQQSESVTHPRRNYISRRKENYY